MDHLHVDDATLSATDSSAFSFGDTAGPANTSDTAGSEAKKENDIQIVEGPNSNECFRIVSQHNDLALDLLEHNGRCCLGVWKQDKERVSQVWRYNRTTKCIENVAFRACLDALGVQGQRDINGCPVGLWKNNERDWQKWLFTEDGQILNKYSMKALDILGFQGNREVPGCIVALWARSRAKWQRWKTVVVKPVDGDDSMVNQLVKAVENMQVRPLEPIEQGKAKGKPVVEYAD
eukprot:m.33662 g.33662  ORF g.33662 m.33662 type:complete len:234 (+) comp8582_c0_seq1:338-1039(+)